MSEEIKKDKKVTEEMNSQELDLETLGQVTGGGMRDKVYIAETKDIDESIKKRI